jgi:hypothetical protein
VVWSGDDVKPRDLDCDGTTSGSTEHCRRANFAHGLSVLTDLISVYMLPRSVTSLPAQSARSNDMYSHRAVAALTPYYPLQLAYRYSMRTPPPTCPVRISLRQSDRTACAVRSETCVSIAPHAVKSSGKEHVASGG